MQSLNRMRQSGAILLRENILSDNERVVGSNPNEELVKCSVMKAAKRKTVIYGRISAWFAIGNDVCGIEHVPKSTEGALLSIGV